MNQKLTEVVFILDRSGSMHGLEKDTIGGFNSMIEEQRDKDGEVLISTVLFNGTSSVLHDRVPIGKIEEMTGRDYKTSGCTALIDAIGGAVRHIRNVHKYIREEDVPAHTLFVITTDGMENASRMYTASDVRYMIRVQEEKDGWEFLFLGANIDAVQTAQRYGIRPERAVDYLNDDRGLATNYQAVSQAVTTMRECGSIDCEWSAPIKADYKKRKKR